MNALGALPARTRMFSDDSEANYGPPNTPMDSRMIKLDSKTSFRTSQNFEGDYRKSDASQPDFLSMEKPRLRMNHGIGLRAPEMGSYDWTNSSDNPPNTPADSLGYLDGSNLNDRRKSSVQEESDEIHRPRANANQRGNEYALTPRTENFLKQSIKASIDNVRHNKFIKSVQDEQDVPPNTPASNMEYLGNASFNEAFNSSYRLHARSPESRDSLMGSP
jgi:hypothetical protein